MRDILIVSVELFSSDVRHSHRQVYGQLMRYADSRGVCWPSQERIARELKCNRRHVQKCIHEMAALGYLVLERVGRRCRYTLKKFFVPPKSAPKDNFRPPGTEIPVTYQKTIRDSRSREREKRDSESVSTNESIAARAREEDKEKKRTNPWCPRSAASIPIECSKKRDCGCKRCVRNRWLGVLSHYVNNCEPTLLLKVCEAASQPASIARPFLNEIDRRMRASPWWRARFAALVEGRRWCPQGSLGEPPAPQGLVPAQDRAARQRAVFEESKRRRLIPIRAA